MADAPTRFVLKWPMHNNIETFSMPDDAKVIDVQVQDGVPCLWTLSSTDSVDVQRTFLSFGTGHPIQEPCEYVGSVHGIDGWMVFHIFERSRT